MPKQSLEKLVLKALEDNKAQAITVLNVRNLTPLTDTVIICSGTSKRHTQSLADQIAQRAKAAGYPPLGVEGVQVGEWILLDLGEVIVHIMIPAAREFYSLEKLWASAETLRQRVRG